MNKYNFLRVCKNSFIRLHNPETQGGIEQALPNNLFQQRRRVYPSSEL